MNALTHASILNSNDSEILVRTDRGDTTTVPMPWGVRVEQDYNEFNFAIELALNASKDELVVGGDIWNMVPIMKGDKILLLDGQVIGVRLLSRDPRCKLPVELPEADLEMPWDKWLVDFATDHPLIRDEKAVKSHNLTKLRSDAAWFIMDRYFPDQNQHAPTFPGFGNLELGGTVLVPYLTNGTTPKQIERWMKNGESRYTVDLGGAYTAKKPHAMWATRLWDTQTDEEVPLSRFCSWDLESALSAVALVAKGIEGR